MASIPRSNRVSRTETISLTGTDSPPTALVLLDPVGHQEPLPPGERGGPGTRVPLGAPSPAGGYDLSRVEIVQNGTPLTTRRSPRWTPGCGWNLETPLANAGGAIAIDERRELSSSRLRRRPDGRLEGPTVWVYEMPSGTRMYVVDDNRTAGIPSLPGTGEFYLELGDFDVANHRIPGS